MADELDREEESQGASDGLASAVESGASEVVQAALPSTGLGVDIVQIARMEQILTRSPGFAHRVFTDAERAYCERHHKPAVHYATHFAAKEAVLKALGTGFAKGIGFTDVEVSHDANGRPIALLHGRAEQIAQELGVLELPLSLSRTADTAVANAIAVTEASRPHTPVKPNPRKELAARFKELRGMLDELDAGQGEEPVEEDEGSRLDMPHEDAAANDTAEPAAAGQPGEGEASGGLQPSASEAPEAQPPAALEDERHE